MEFIIVYQIRWQISLSGFIYIGENVICLGRIGTSAAGIAGDWGRELIRERGRVFRGGRRAGKGAIVVNRKISTRLYYVFTCNTGLSFAIYAGVLFRILMTNMLFCLMKACDKQI